MRQIKQTYGEERKQLTGPLFLACAAVLYLVSSLVTIEEQWRTSALALGFVLAGYNAIYLAYEAIRQFKFTDDNVLTVAAGIILFMAGRGSDGLLVMIIYAIGLWVEYWISGKSISQTVTSLNEALESVDGDRERFNNLTQISRSPLYSSISHIASVIGYGLMAAGIYLAIINNGNDRGLAMLAVLMVLACGRTVRMVIWLLVYAALGKCATKGILIKGVEYLEAAGNADCLAFADDELFSAGQYEVIDVDTVGDRDELLKICASIVNNTDHPMAEAIVREYGIGREYRIIRHYHEEKGLGVDARVGNRTYWLGNHEYMKKLKVQKLPKDDGIPAVYVSADGEYAGKIVFRQAIKDEAVSQVRKLKNNGFRKTMILASADERRFTELKEAARFDAVYGSLSEEGKVDIIRKERTNGSKVMFVGNGEEDGPALAMANVGVISNQADTHDVAGCDMIIKGDCLQGLLEIRKETETLRENVRNSAVVISAAKIIALVLVYQGWLPVWAAMIVDLMAGIMMMNTAKIK